MNKEKTYEITIKVDAQQIEDMAQHVLDFTSDALIDNGLPRTKETIELVLNTAIEQIEDYLF